MNLKGKVAIVTGGGKGIGEAAALRFAREGAAVLVADIDEAAGRSVIERIVDGGGRAKFFYGDLTKLKTAQEMVEATIVSFGGLDYAVNNVGGSLKGSAPPIHEIDPVALEADLQLNLYTAIFSTRAEISYLIGAKRSGAIVNVSSLAGISGNGSNPGYGISKHGIIGLTRHAAVTYGPQGIRVNVICPGGVLTPGFELNFGGDADIVEKISNSLPLRRISTPNEIANLAVWLCSDEASFMTGAVIPIDGGASASISGSTSKRRDE